MGKIKHLASKTDLYHVWQSMRQRCFNPSCHAFDRYGGRGITVSKEWDDPAQFISWAKNSGYQKGLSLERIDVNGDYTPDNCTWITMEEQAKNKRTSVTLTLNGETHCVAEWSRILGVHDATLRNRIKRGLPIEKVLTSRKERNRKSIRETSNE